MKCRGVVAGRGPPGGVYRGARWPRVGGSEVADQVGVGLAFDRAVAVKLDQFPSNAPRFGVLSRASISAFLGNRRS
jgi:hypothetical protein